MKPLQRRKENHSDFGFNLHTRQIKLKINQFYAVYRTQHGRPRQPKVKTLRSPLSANFWRRVERWRCSTPRFATTLDRRNGNIKLNKCFFEWGSNLQPIAFTLRLTLICAFAHFQHKIMRLYFHEINEINKRDLNPQVRINNILIF